MRKQNMEYMKMYYLYERKIGSDMCLEFDNLLVDKV